MTKAAALPFDWLRYVNKLLLQHDEVPLLASPPFDWSKFNQTINDALELKELIISPKEWCWRSKEDLLSGLTEPLYPSQINLEPLQGSAYWLMNESDVGKLLTWVLAKKSEPLPIIEKDYQEAFYRFLMMEALYCYQQQSGDSTLNPTFQLTHDKPQSDSLCLDVHFSFQNSSIWGRLTLSPELRKAWKEYHIQDQHGLKANAMAQDLEVNIRLEGGKMGLSYKQWSQVKPGDFLVLDYCTLDPVEKKWRVSLMLNDQPLFRGRIRKGKLKLYDYPLYKEVDNGMAKEPEDDDEDFFEEEGDGLSEFEEHEEMTDEIDEVPPTDNSPPITTPKAVKSHTETPSTEALGQSGPLQLGDIPLQLVIEVARIKMSVQTLMNLQPGNLLELNVQPEQGIDLVVGGNKVGRGELLRIGETLGVRILEIG